MSLLDELDAQVASCMLKDRFPFRQKLRRAQQLKHPEKKPEFIKKLQRQISESMDLLARRKRTLPQPKSNVELPIAEHAEEIISAIRENQVVVIAGQTGSGKSTQLPQLCLQAGFGVTGMIGHTQPRRIAARTIASRIAQELKTSVGKEIGFKIRFTDKTEPTSFVKLMTDGILLAETQTDRFLEQYEVIILDEAHERTLNIDFLIGYLHRLMPRRQDLRIIITSATLDANRFSKHFSSSDGPAPIIEVSGRTYPVEVLYRPFRNDDATGESDEERDLNDAIVQAVDELADFDHGDVLVFLPTERHIRSAAKRLRAEFLNRPNDSKTQILPLYARLSTAEQNKIFNTGKHRRVVLATNVAESSLTVPGIRNVVDTGTARISRYSPRLKVQRLPIEAISRASAEQRKGRCGRTAPGICVRLYDEDDFDSRDEFTTPEIRRTNLAAVILQAMSLKLGPIEQIAFLDPPRPETIRDGYQTLFELGAVDGNRELTEIGHQLARMPVDPRIGRMILAGNREGCLAEVLVLASALEVQDPRDRPHDKQQKADERHAQFTHEKSDFLAFLAIWEFFHRQRENLSRSQLQKACQHNFLSMARIREWLEVHRQLADIVRQSKMKITSKRKDYSAIHRSLLSGLLSGVATRTADFEYTGAGGVKFFLWPGSGLFEHKPNWIIAAELVETSKRFGRIVADIHPDWIEPLALHLIKRSYSDPHWHVKSETVMAFEKVTLFGLPIVPKRRARYGSIDLAAARSIFIQQALVDRKMSSTFPFVQNNQRVLHQLQSLADKTRRRDLLVDEYTLYGLYDQRLPDGVFDVASLKRWLQRHKQKRNESLSFRITDFQADDPVEEHASLFPDSLQIGSIETPLNYQFSPGNQNDGITITLPLEGLKQVNTTNTGWLVPGLMEEKIIALIRSLPKNIRRNLVPAPDTAKKVAHRLNYGQGDLLAHVAHHLAKIAEQPIRVSDFRMEQIPDHLKMNFRVVDSDGNDLALGRDLQEIKRQIGAVASDPTDVHHDDWHRDGITEWDFDELPTEFLLDRGGIAVPMYPGLVDLGSSAGLRLFDSKQAAKHQTRRGLMRLIALAKRKSLRAQVRWLPNWDKNRVFAAQMMGAQNVDSQMQELIALTSIHRLKKLPRNRASFEELLASSNELIGVATQEVSQLAAKLFGAHHEAKCAWESLPSSNWQYAWTDMGNQINELTGEGFLMETPFRWLQQFPRYFEAICYRIDKLRSGGQTRDEKGTNEVARFWRRFKEISVEFPDASSNAELQEFRWMIEEFRVSLFAQPLGTFGKISAQRLSKQLQKAQEAIRFG